MPPAPPLTTITGSVTLATPPACNPLAKKPAREVQLSLHPPGRLVRGTPTRAIRTALLRCCDRASGETAGMRTRCPPAPDARSAFAGFRFPPEVIVLAVRWYLRFGLSYRDVEELLAERGSRSTMSRVYRWVQRFTPLLAEAARPCRHAVGDRWYVDETYVKVAGQWRYVYRAIDQFGQVIDVFVSARRDTKAARRFFERAVGTTKVRRSRSSPTEQPTTRSCWRSCCRRRGTEPSSTPTTGSRPTTGGLKARLRPMRGLKQDRSARVIIAGHAFVQNLRRGHYELAVEEPVNRRVAIAFAELAWQSDPGRVGLQHAPGWQNATAPHRLPPGSWR